MPEMFTLILALIFALSFMVLFRVTMRDPYGLYHLALNREPGENRNLTPKTEWLNQGYWKSTTSFPEACRALALKLVEAAKLKGGSRVLDVGHGTGESLIMFLMDPAVPRPSRLTGVTSLTSHYERSKERVARVCASNDEAAEVRVDLYHGDVICRPTTPPTHPLHVLNAAKFDVIFALDCAFHFSPRKEFLAQAYQKLTPGGRIVLGDLCFGFDTDGPPTQKSTLPNTAAIIGLIPKENIVSTREYIRSLEELGYTDVELEDITSDVFPGFVKFLCTKGVLWRVYASILGWYRRVVHMRFVVVTGRKPLI